MLLFDEFYQLWMQPLAIEGFDIRVIDIRYLIYSASGGGGNHGLGKSSRSSAVMLYALG